MNRASALLGLLVLAGARAPAWAAPTADATLNVRPYAGVPPAAINDLAVTSTAQVGQLRLNWTAPTVFPGTTLDSYQVRVQTFSLANVGGSTTTWWNSSGGLTLQAFYGESPGQAVTRTLGPPGSDFSAALIPGATYYLAVRSADDLGSPQDDWSDVTQVIKGIPAVPVVPPSGTPPQMPNGVLSTPLSNGLQVTLSWTPVTRDTTGAPATIAHYLIYRYTAIGDTPTVVATVNAPLSAYTENTAGTVAYYRIQAVSTTGAVSALSDYLDSSSEGNRYALASDDLTTRVVMPHDAALVLQAANNVYKEDLEIILTRQAQDESNVTLRSYRIAAQVALTGQVITQFTFPQNNISVQLGYGSVISPSLGGSQTRISAAALAQVISVYWFNGASFIRVGSPVLTFDQAIAVTVRNLGVYQIKAITLASQFRLTQGSPYPRVITPNGAENRRVFWFFENPSNEEVTGTVYDIRGAHVRGLRVDSASPTPNSLVWDGRDDRGAVVPSGVYLYKISSPDGTATGTVVVAR